MKNRKIIALAICICIISIMFSGLTLSAASGFETNMEGWKSACGTTWTNDETGYWNGKHEEDAATQNFKHLAVSDTVISRDKSFTYEIKYKFSGYGVGLALNVVDRSNFYAIEVNTNKYVYFPSVKNGQWALYGPHENVATDEQINPDVIHTLMFEYDAKSGGGVVYLDGTKSVEIIYIPDSAFGNLGLYYENGEATFLSAKYTEKTSDSGDTGNTEKTFDTNMGEWVSADGATWAETSKGFFCTNPGGRHAAKSSIVVDDTQSFEYEVVFSYSGYGAGIAFNVLDNQNLAAVEVNHGGRVYFPMLVEGTYSEFYSEGTRQTEEQLNATEHTLKFVYFAMDEAAEVYLDGELMQEIWFDDPSVICGNLGVYYEDATVYITKATYTEIEEPTPAPATPTPETTQAPATQEPTQAPTEVPATQEPVENTDNDGISPVLIVVLVVIALLVVCVGVLVLLKAKKK